MLIDAVCVLLVEVADGDELPLSNVSFLLQVMGL